jgi:hypothetical protein
MVVFDVATEIHKYGGHSNITSHLQAVYHGSWQQFVNSSHVLGEPVQYPAWKIINK